MKEGYTPSETLEAQDNREKNMKGIEEANFYRDFIDSVIKGLKDRLKTKDMDTKMSDLKLIFIPGIPEIMAEAAKEANMKNSTDISPSYSTVGDDGEMTPNEFIQHLEEQRAGLKQ